MLTSSRRSVPAAVPAVVLALGFATGCARTEGRFRAPTPAVDLGLPAVDEGMAGEAGECVSDEPFTVLEGGGPYRFPALARVNLDHLLVVTEGEPDAQVLTAHPLTPIGAPRGDAQDIGVGAGGTLLGATLGFAEPGFTVAFLDSGRFSGARMDVDGRVTIAPIAGQPSSSFTPLLIFTPNLAVNGWVQDGVPTGFVQGLSPLTANFELTFPGRGMRGARDTATPRQFRVASHDEESVFLETRDGQGEVLASEAVPLRSDDVPFPTSIRSVRVVDDEPSALAVFAGTVRALDDAIIEARLDGREAEWFYGDTFLNGGDAAFDARSGWLGVAAGIQGSPAPRILFLGLHRSGATMEVSIDTQPVDRPVPYEVAIIETGIIAPSFLLVWTTASADGPLVRGVTIRCGV